SGGSIQILAALSLDDLAELVPLHVLDGSLFCVMEGFLHLFQLLRIASYSLLPFMLKSDIRLFFLLQGDLLGFVVGCTDGRGALEGHVLEHMRHAGLSLGILG